MSYAGDMSVRKLKYEIFKVLCKYIYKVGAGDSCKKIFEIFHVLYRDIKLERVNMKKCRIFKLQSPAAQ